MTVRRLPLHLPRGLRRAGLRPAASRSEAGLLRHMSWRWGLQIGVCVAVIVAVLSGLAVLIVLRSQQSAANTLLTEAAARADDVTDPPAGVWLVIADTHGVNATPGLPGALPDRDALDQVTRTGVAEMDIVPGTGAMYQVYTQRKSTDTVQAVLDLRANYDERERLLAAMLASGGLGLLLAAAAGAWFGRRATAPIATALALQRRFVSDASHELRTPLTYLSMRAQLALRHLRRGDQPRQLAAEMSGLVEDAEHLSVILDDLLLAADTRPQTQHERVDLVVLIAQVVAASTPAAAEQGIAIANHPGAASSLVLGSSGSLRRALTAVVDNAVQHATHTVTISVHRAGGEVVADVEDDGVGIDPAILPHMFERFASTRNAADDEPPIMRRRHYGIGLALVSEIASRHGGTITAHNRAEGGATLRLSLPALAPDEAGT